MSILKIEAILLTVGKKYFNTPSHSVGFKCFFSCQSVTDNDNSLFGTFISFANPLDPQIDALLIGAEYVIFLEVSFAL